MKTTVKLAGSLILDQIIGIVAGFMFVLCVSAIFRNSITGYLIAFIICFGLYYYAAYLSAQKAGFHDSHRVLRDDSYKGFYYKGALAGILSAIPLLAIFLLYSFFQKKILAVYFMIANMYWTWPLCGIFPNHVPAVMSLSFLPIIIVPWAAYISGYRSFYFKETVFSLYKKILQKKG